MNVDLSAISWETIFKSFAVVLAIIAAFGVVFKQITGGFNCLRKKANAKDQLIEKVDGYATDISKLFEILEKHIEDSKEEKKQLAETLKEHIRESKKDSVAVMRDKITQIYRLTINKGYILDQDSQNYASMLERYDANDGNSYVHEEIVPRMKLFKVFFTDEEGQEYVADLKKRGGMKDEI